MNFEFEIQTLETEALLVRYFFVPWDSELMNRPVAQVSCVEIRDPDQAKHDIGGFLEWIEENGIAFVTARFKHSALLETRLMQDLGYGFVELNFRPEITLSSSISATPASYFFRQAAPSEIARLSDLAGTTFSRTRFHLDPFLGPAIGNNRYRMWMRNAFEHPSQEVLICEMAGELAAFFVQERPQPNQVFWSLVGLVPEKQGKRLARSVWTALLSELRDVGVAKVSTSISSLNSPVLNLYASLGFRFPEPEAVFHWHRNSEREGL